MLNVLCLVFGNTQPAQQQPTSGLFGGGSGGGVFGNNQQQSQQQPGQSNAFGMFGGPKPATSTTTGLFGGGVFGQNAATANTAPQQATGLFGSTLGQPTTQPSTGLFGKPVMPTTGIALSAGQPPMFGNSLTGSTLNTSVAGANQGALQASIAQPFPIFSLLPSQPSALTLDQPKKKPSMFDVPARSPAPRAFVYQPAPSKLRGYTSTMKTSTVNGLGKSTNSAGLSFTSGKPNALTLSGTNGKNGGDAFGSSSQLGTGPKQSVKKLILDKKVDPADLLRRSSASPSPAKASFNPALSVAAREKDTAVLALPAPETSLSPSPAARSRGRFIGQSPSDALLASQSEDARTDKEPQEGDYLSEPSIAILSKLGYDALAKVKGLVVSRIGYGQIEFLEPVDLTTLTKLGELLGEQVRFDDQACSVYPDSDDVDKPPPGSGLNVRARITLLRCWALDKATREPIKDEKHPLLVKHLKRLKNMKHTEFVNFDVQEGKWTFIVDHF